MAEAVLFSTAEKLLKTLGRLIIQEVVSDLGARADLEKLVDKLRIIRGVLLDAEQKEQSDSAVKLWFESLRCVVYDADDLAEELSAVVRSRELISESKMWRTVRIFFSRTNPLLLNHELAGKLRVIRERLDTMAPNMTSLLNLKLDVRLVDEQIVAHKGKEKTTDSYVPKGDVIGREEDEKELVNMLLNKEDQESTGGRRPATKVVSSKKELPRVISLVSIGGLGKTCLAQLVCQNEQIQQHFDLTAWVCISDNFDVKLIVLELVKRIVHDSDKIMRTLKAGSEDTTITIGGPGRNISEGGHDNAAGRGEFVGGKDDHLEDNSSALLRRLEDYRGRDNLDSSRWAELGPFLQQILREIKYLIVLDDVWNESLEKWLDLRKYLQGTSHCGRSRILVTTRLETAAKVIGSGDDDIYHLQPLRPGASWALFKNIAFGDADMEDQDITGVSPELLDMGRNIVNKCCNHPLAIRNFASFFGSRCKKEAEWKSIMEDELQRLNNSDSNNGYLVSLRLSYNHLASELKHCFAFCALFPQDYKMPIEWLAQLWAAHGFIIRSPQSSTTSTMGSHKNLEDIAHSYLMELLSRDFFLEVKKDPYGNIHCVKVHDLMHDLAKAVAGQNMVLANAVGDDVVRNANSSYQQEFDAGILHVCIRGVTSSWRAPPTLLKAKRLRTFYLAYRTDSAHLKTPALDEIFRNFRYLRVLDLHAVVKSPSLPRSIGKLKLLRFLDLSLNYALVHLPDSITQLVNLQTLDLHGCERLETLPLHFGKLVSLTFLDVSKCDRLLKSFRGKKENHPALPRRLTHHVRVSEACFEPQQCWWKSGSHVLTLSGHCNSTSAEILRIRVDRGLFNDVHGDISILEVTGYEEERFPCWQINDSPSNFSSLTRICITCCKYFRHLPAFSQLPCLKVLVLKKMAALTYIETGCRHSLLSSSSFFGELAQLELSDLPVLEGWSIEAATIELDQNINHLLPSFPVLSTLTILNCPNLKSFPRAAEVKNPTLKGVPDVLEQMFWE